MSSIYIHAYKYVYIMDYYSAIKNEILPFATSWIDLEGIMLSELSHTKTNTVWFQLCAESKTKQNKWTNKTKQKQTHRYTEQTVARREGAGEQIK